MATIIIPLSGNKDIVRDIKKQTDDNDSVSFFHFTSKNIESLLNKTISESNSDNIIIINSNDQNIERKNFKFLKLMKEYDGTVVSNFVKGRNEITNKTSIKFNKSNGNPVEKESKNLKDYLKNISISLDKNDIVNINDNSIKSKNGKPKPESTVKVTVSPKKEKKRGINKRKRTNQKLPNVEYINSFEKNNNLPSILMIVDVKGWAGGIKSQYIKKYLEPYYNIDIINSFGDGQRVHKSNYERYNLCFTYGYFFISKIKRVSKKKRITGLTAHRHINIIKSAMGLAHATHANSVLLYNELKQIHKNSFYIPNGVDTDLFIEKTPILSKDEMIFGHVGKQSPMKGQLDFIEPSINLTQVKYFSHYNNYKTKVSHQKMADIHQNYDVFICASKEDGTPCPALEAAACGRPIISNKIGNMPELIENYKTGILLDKKDIDLYVDAIKGCKDNPDKVLEMSKNIQKKIQEEGTGELMTKNYLYMFDNILNIKRDASVYENPARYHVK